jgi:hypothetical protein
MPARRVVQYLRLGSYYDVAGTLESGAADSKEGSRERLGALDGRQRSLKTPAAVSVMSDSHHCLLDTLLAAPDLATIATPE